MTAQPFSIPSVIIALAAIPLVLGAIPRNGWYGVRTQKTLSEDRIWYKANRFGGWLLLFSSLIYLMVANFYPIAGPHDPHFPLWLFHLGAFVLPLLVSLMLILGYIKSL